MNEVVPDFDNLPPDDLVDALLLRFDSDLRERRLLNWNQYLGLCKDSTAKAHLLSRMIQCELDLSNWDAARIRNRFCHYPAVGGKNNWILFIVRRLYMDRVESGERPCLSEFDAFGLAPNILQLRMDDEPIYLGQDVAGRYRVEQRLGKGNFGIVYRALDLAENRLVVVKTVLVADVDHEQIATKMLQREFEWLSKLKGVGLPRAYDYVVGVDNRPCLILELCDGRTLHEVKKKGPLAPERAARIVAKIAETLQGVHRNGLMHRDLSPSNILVDDDDVPMLLDFGLAVTPDEQFDDKSTIAGTPGYMSLAAAAGDSLLDIRSDIHGLGVILFQLLTARSAAATHGKFRAYDATFAFQWEFNRSNFDIPSKLKSICEKCMATDAMDGYENAGMLARDLRAFLGDHLSPLDANAELAQYRLFAWRLGTTFGLAWGSHAEAKSYWQRTSVAEHDPYAAFRNRIIFSCESSMLSDLRKCVEGASRIGVVVSVAEDNLDCREARNGPNALIPDVELWITQYLDRVDRELQGVQIQLESHFGAYGPDALALFDLAAVLASCCTGAPLKEMLQDLAKKAALSTAYLDGYMELTSQGSWLDLKDESKRAYKHIEWELTNRLADEMDGRY